ncbi:NAD-dependent epimerase/dehydratase family protein [Pendulispora albinea]|uniref:NAD-dependent epimerase/dehydratase family protein n=1 Tax=Pendulispora albinea TaxID=2741071 RepID=A0ABZ2LRH3_9BACT
MGEGRAGMKVLVTGANGLVGANLVRELLHRNVDVHAMVRATSRLEALQGTAAPRVLGDVLQSPDLLARPMRGCEIVFHAAAHFTYDRVSDDALVRTSVTGTQNVLRAAAMAGVRRVVVTSSSVIFGSSPTPRWLDETAPRGAVSADGFVEPVYVASKVQQDVAAAELARELGLEIVFTCPTMCVGPYGTVLGPSNGVIVAYLSDPLRMTYPGGCNIVSVRDVAAGHWLAATRGTAGEHYLLGGENLQWEQIHALVAGLCGADPPRTRINHTLAFAAAGFEELRARFERRAALTTRQQARLVGRYYWYSHAKAAAMGYAPRTARAALAEACAWLAGSEHVSRELRSTLRLHAEVHAARRALGAWDRSEAR